MKTSNCPSFYYLRAGFALRGQGRVKGPLLLGIGAPAQTVVDASQRDCVWKGLPVMCGPRGLPKAHNALYRNNGDGTFTDVSEKSAF
jgi:hypothetical protein